MGHETKKIPTMHIGDIMRFCSKIRMNTEDPDKGCHEWEANANRDGYGSFSIRGDMYAAHRISYKLGHPTWNEKSMILHRCDNPRCVRLDHLFSGNALRNNIDMIRKGRGSKQKLTYEQANEIRRKYKQGTSAHQLKKEYNMSAEMLCMILQNKTYTNPRHKPISRRSRNKTTQIKGYSIAQRPNGTYELKIRGAHIGTFPTASEAEQAALRKILPTFII